MMADLAAINHWSMESMEAMALDDLIAHRNRAVERWNLMNGHKG